MQGVVRSIVVDQATGARKGFGFITPDHWKDEKGDHFFHSSTLDPSTIPFLQVQEGQRVEFDSQESPKGLRAINVRITS